MPERKSISFLTGWLDANDERNLLRYIFLRPEARPLMRDWPARAPCRSYRVYFVRRREVMVILLCGGDKGTQARDIEAARRLAKTV